MVKRTIKSVFKFKPFSRKQKGILTWWLDTSPVSDKDGIIADGAIRSGKTISMALSYVLWAMTTFHGQNFGMAGKTIGSFRRNVLFILKVMLLTRGYRYKDNKTENMLEVYRNGVVNYFYIFGGKDEKSQDLIQGITLAGMFCDEVALMPRSFVEQATGRCSVEGSKYWFNCNPDGPYHWFKLEWIDDPEKNMLYLHFRMEDNLSLSEKIRQRYERMYSGVFYQRYILGQWTVAEGIIYDMFEKAKHVTGRVFEYLANQTYISIDYGTQNATVFLMWKKNADGTWVCVKEYYYSGREMKKQKTDVQFADDLEAFIEGEKVKSVILDPSAASFKTELKQRGIYVKNAKNDVTDGIRTVATLLNKEEILFHEGCKETIKEFSAYSWDSKAAARGEDKPMKENDHAMDAVRYFCYTILKGNGWKI